ncbi:TetR/AcrR family transcriptional regulator [Pseudomonas fluorescens]|uniref:TetR/AcrR family transcriptional regulator n=1 Tax=Pseudomonas fluorescens TaxID=294 RepID=UPI00073235D8|nr:TetR/AcrR family transcriptional regulator [Pseudomonas fluorescens]
MTAAQRRIHEAAMRLFAEKGAGEISISELAEAAGVARGTIYKHLDSVEGLFRDVAARLSEEMDQRIARSSPEDVDPALRLANGIRYYIRRAHEEPSWGKFIVRYAMSSQSLRGMWAGQPLADLMTGLGQKRYDVRQEQLMSVLAMIGGSVLTAITLVRDGHRTWRDAGSDIAELTLRALGLSKDEAQALATVELPPLAPV